MHLFYIFFVCRTFFILKLKWKTCFIHMISVCVFFCFSYIFRNNCTYFYMRAAMLQLSFWTDFKTDVCCKCTFSKSKSQSLIFFSFFADIKVQLVLHAKNTQLEKSFVQEKSLLYMCSICKNRWKFSKKLNIGTGVKYLSIFVWKLLEYMCVSNSLKLNVNNIWLSKFQ